MSCFENDRKDHEGRVVIMTKGIKEVWAGKCEMQPLVKRCAQLALKSSKNRL